MTSISSLMQMPSLVNYLEKNGASAAQIATSTTSSLAGYLAATDSGMGLGDTISLSAQAQAMLATQGAAATGGTGDADGGKSAKAGATDFIAKFFESNGIDTDKLSEDAQNLLKGIDKIIDNMSGVTRDAGFDNMTSSYVRGQRQSFTLSGNGQRLTATVQYDNGKPVSLTVSNVQGGTATSAAMTLGMDSAGKPSTIEISRTEKKYNSMGAIMSTVAGDPLSVELYA